MDQLSFRVVEKTRNDFVVSFAEIWINGVSLIELLRNFEKKFDTKTPGDYAALDLYDFKPMLLGPKPEEWVNILGCTCGEVGCWPFQTQVSLEKETVTWTAFRQRHRCNSNEPNLNWDYSGFGPFSFLRDSYEKEISVLKTIPFSRPANQTTNNQTTKEKK